MMKNFTDTPFFEGKASYIESEEDKKQESNQDISSKESFSDGNFFNFVVVSGKLYKILNSNTVDTNDGTKLKCVNVVVRTRHKVDANIDTFIKLSFWGSSAEAIEKNFDFDKEIMINGYFKSMNFGSRNFPNDNNKENIPIEFVVKQIISKL